MEPKSKQRFRFVAGVIDGVLLPMGFRKQKTNWRREIGEVLQQFSIDSKQRNDEYSPVWGLNILARNEDPAPQANMWNVNWGLEMVVKDNNERLGYLLCFKFGIDLLDEVRETQVRALLKKYVIPCFEVITTQESVRRMMGDLKHPRRAQAYVRLPYAW